MTISLINILFTIGDELTTVGIFASAFRENVPFAATSSLSVLQ